MNVRKMNTDTRFKTLLFSLWSLVFSLLLAGCAKQQQYEAIERICVPGMGKARIMHVAEDVLGQMHFAVEKFDVENGFIRSRPLPGAKFFEFWRSDNVGASNASEANLHSIRRIVEVNISRQDGQLCIDCDVSVQRLSLPQRYVTSTFGAQEMFSQTDSSIQTLRLHPEQKKAMAWINLGRDTKLATKILKRIEKQITSDGTRATRNDK